MAVPSKAEKVKPGVYHDEEIRRGFRVLHEHLDLAVDFDTHSLRGVAEFSLRVLNPNCVDVKLNLRRCHVQSCSVNGRPSAFEYTSALDFPPLLDAVSSDSPPHRTEDVKAEASMQNSMAGDGELTIAIPPGLSADILDDLKALAANGEDGKAAAGVPQSLPPTAQLHEFPALTVRIEYRVSNPTAGAVFYGNVATDNRLVDPMYMMTESRYGLVRCWMPCFDSRHWCDRYIFDIDVTVQSELVVVASGDLAETRIVPADEQNASERKRFSYRNGVPANAKEIVVAVGPFMPFPDPVLPQTVTHFCLPGQAEKLVQTSPPIFASALAFCRDYFGFDPPCTSFKQLFLGSLGESQETNFCAAGGLAVLSGKLLCSPRCIDAGFEAREAIMSTLVQSYIGCLLRPRGADDAWLIKGLAAHVTTLGLQSLFGRNWFRFRMLDEMNILCQEQPSQAALLSPVDPGVHIDVSAQSASRRGHVIVYMIERRIGSDIMRRALRDLVAEGRSVILALATSYEKCKASQLSTCFSNESINHLVLRAFTAPNSLDLAETEPMEDSIASGDGGSPVASKRVGATGTSSGYDDGLMGIGAGPFQKRLRAICGTDVRGLVRLWAPSRGVPRMQFGYRYNPRRHVIEFVGKQEGLEVGSYYKGKAGLQFVGTVHIKVMEVEGASDHSVEIRDSYFLVELPCHSRRTKQKSTTQGEKSARDDSSPASPIVWVRVDTDMEWCMDASFTQVESAWTSLLKSERDSVAQYKACRGLAQFGTETAGKALAGILEDNQVYWRVHAEAADALAQCKGGLEALLKFCRTRYTDQGDDGRENVKLNNFGDFRSYFVKRAVVKAIVKTRESNESNRAQRAKIPADAVNFILELLKGNDNAGNAYDDDYYVADLITAAGIIAVEGVKDQNFSGRGEGTTSASGRAIQQINRYKALDRLLPSKSGAVACAVLKALAEYEAAKLGTLERNRRGTPIQDMMRSRHKPNETLLQLMYRHCSSNNQLQVRLQALESLALVYSGDLEVCLWLLGRVDRYFSGLDVIDQAFGRQAASRNTERMEPPAVRLRVLEALNAAVRTSLWGRDDAPVVKSLRQQSARAREICVRIRRLMVGDADDRVRRLASQFATKVWGSGAPVCFLNRTEYYHAVNAFKMNAGDPSKLKKRVIPFEFRLKEEIAPKPPLKPIKASKPSKSHKTHRHHHRSSKSASVEPQTFGNSSGMDDSDFPTLEEIQPNPRPSKSKPKAVSLRSKAPAKPASAPMITSLDTPIGQYKPVSKSVLQKPDPRSAPKPPAAEAAPRPHAPPPPSPSARPTSKMSFAAHKLDREDVRFIRKAWKERQRRPEERGCGGKHAVGEVIDVGAVDDGRQRDDGDRKKKKKKKRKRDGDGEEGDDRGDKERRKKKKKKKRRHGGEEYGKADEGADGGRAGSSSRALPGAEPKIGKFKIKLNRPVS